MPEGSLWFFFIINHVQLQKMTEPKASPICLMLIMQTEWRWRCNGSVARFVLINAIIIIIKIMDTFQQSLRRNWIRLKNKYKYIIWEDGILLTRDQNVISASFFLSGCLRRFNNHTLGGFFDLLSKGNAPPTLLALYKEYHTRRMRQRLPFR